jgi:hypothetical protein
MPEQRAQSQSTAATKSRPSNAAVESILLDLFPNKLLMDAAAFLTKLSGESTEDSLTKKFNADVETERQRLLNLSTSELNALHFRVTEKRALQSAAKEAQDKSGREAKAAAKEAEKFYNQSTAEADFTFWMKAEYWTFDETVALLLGRNPRVVTAAAMKREMEPGLEALLSPNQRSPLREFVQQYQRLRLLAERASALDSPRLKPIEAVDWAHRSQAVDIPPALQCLLIPDQPENSKKQVPGVPEKIEHLPTNDVQNAMEDGTAKRWTPEKLRELAAYRNQYGTLATAKKFTISASRIRQLLPKESQEAKKSSKLKPRSLWAGL